MPALRGLAAAGAICAALLVSTAADAASARSWAQPQIRVVVARGIFDGPVSNFDADAPLTRQALVHAVAKLTGGTETAPPDGTEPVSLAELDATLVRALGLGGAAHRVYLSAQQAGLRPPGRFGTEVVARLLGLRLNHPDGQDDLELQPQQPATRAEAAYSLAQILSFGGPPSRQIGAGNRVVSGSGVAAVADVSGTWPVQAADGASRTFALADLTDWQRRVLTAAVSYIGFPYVWGGTGEDSPGFDCSGFVWRVYRLTPYVDELSLADTLRGRTTMEMSGEVPRTERIAFASLEPGDVLFFGKGRRSKPAQVDHTGIYLGNGWFIHSSGYGVAVAQLEGWYRSSFAWARRPLAEAGLA
jgi:cell wall-associated NlpC family hydrolase